MRNLDKISESGMTRRYWKTFCKDNKCAENRVINAKNTAFEIAFRQLSKWKDSWQFAYDCFRLKNLSEKGRALLPKLP
jgi:hypothetical protein